MKKHGFQRFVLVLLTLVSTPLLLQAAFVRGLPLTLVQPDGQTISAFITGDEFHRWVHDRNGYAIIKNPESGYYVYAVRRGGGIEASAFRVGVWNPGALGIERNLGPALAGQSPIRLPDVSGGRRGIQGIVGAPSTGALNNIVIFIRFFDDSEFGEPISLYNSMFNASGPTSNSLREYFYEVSYSQLTIPSTFYPLPSGGAVVSYQDSHIRGYYRPYDSVSNPDGYMPGGGGAREGALLRAAVNAVSSQVPPDLNVDGDNDNYVDDVCFMIRGAVDAWASLLWPHASSLPYEPWVYINGKKVNAYNLQIQDYVKPSGLGVGVLCHEMFHVLGAPDLYRYYDRSIEPVSIWDVMGTPDNPPQHMGAYMKCRYGHWLASLPEITTAGRYSLHPLASSSGNCYMVKSRGSTTEYFVLEYRKKVGTFEGTLATEGLLVYRINPSQCGNSSGPPDEVYIYRPGGTLTVSGEIYSAVFSQDSGRTSLDDSTDPSCFLSDGTEGKLKLSGVGSMGDTISFSVDWSYTPALTTAAVANISDTEAYGGGTVNRAFGRKITARGVCWDTAPKPTIANPHTVDGSGTGSFASHLTGLEGGGVLYHVRAYATSTAGTGYGNDVTFRTPSPFAVTTARVTGNSQTEATSGGTVAVTGEASVKDRGVCWSTSLNPTTADFHTHDGSGAGTFVSKMTPLTPGTSYHVRAYATDLVLTTYGDDVQFWTASGPFSVTAPSTGARWTRGTTQTIQWQKGYSTDPYVAIALYKGTAKIQDISIKTANDGSFSWIIPATTTPGVDYQIKINTLDGHDSAASGNFTIAKPALTITAPLAGAIWTRGTTATITWTKTGKQNANVKILLFRGATKLKTIALKTPNDGQFDWPVPASLPAASDYKVKIKTVDGLFNDVSGLFTIH